LQEITFDKFIEILKINPKTRTEEHIECLKAYIQEKNPIETLIKDKTQEIDKNLIIECFSNFMDIQFAQKNEVLFRMDDDGENFFIILKGGVEIYIPDKRKLWLSRLEYYKYLEKNLYEEEIGLVKSILNSNYEKISFDNYEDFNEFAKAKAKITLIEKFKTITDENLLGEFYKENSIILRIFKIANSLQEINYFTEDNHIVELSESNETTMSEKDSDNSDTNDKLEEYDKNFLYSSMSETLFKINQEKCEAIYNSNNLNYLDSPIKSTRKKYINKKETIPFKASQSKNSGDVINQEEVFKLELKKIRSYEDTHNPNKKSKIEKNNSSIVASDISSNLKKSISTSNLNSNEFFNLRNKKNFTKKDNFIKIEENNFNSVNNFTKKYEEKSISNFPDSQLVVKNNIDFKKKTKENIRIKFELTNKEEYILKKYSLMDNDALKLQYNVIITQPLCLGEKDYFGDYALEDKNKKRKATAKCTEDKTILGFITSEVYNEYIFQRNKNIINKNIKVLNDLSFFKNISFADFQKYCYNKFELKKYNKNETLFESNNEISEVLIIKEGKVDVSLMANIFDLENITNEILKNFPIDNANLTPEDNQLLEDINNKRININLFNKDQKENLLIRKNVNFFSLEKSGIIAIEPYFLKLKCFYKVIPVSERVSVYSLSGENLEKIFTQFSDSRINFHKLAIKKCLIVLSRLNEIKNSILSISHIKFNNLPKKNRTGDSDFSINKNTSSKIICKSIITPKYTTSNVLPNIRLNFINKENKVKFLKDLSIDRIDNINSKENIENSNNLSNKSNNINNFKINKSKNNLSSDKYNNQNTNLNDKKNPDEVNNMFLVQDKNIKQNSPIHKNFIQNNYKSEYYFNENDNLTNNTKIKNHVHNNLILKPINNKNYNSSKVLPFISSSFMNADKILDNKKFNFTGNNIDQEEFSIEKKVLSENEIPISIPKESRLISKNNNINFSSSELLESKFSKTSRNFKRFYFNNASNTDQVKNETLKNHDLYNDQLNPNKSNNINEDFDEENLFFFNKKLPLDKEIKSFSNKIQTNVINSFKYLSNIVKINSNKSLEKSNFIKININKNSSLNDIQKVESLNSDKGMNYFNVSTQTFTNLEENKIPKTDEICDIKIYNFSNVYDKGAENSNKLKNSLIKSNIIIEDKLYEKFNSIEKHNSINLYNDSNFANQENYCHNIERKKSGLLNKSVFQIHRLKKFFSDNSLINGNNKNIFQENPSLAKPLAIKNFENVEFEVKKSKITHSFKNSVINIQSLKRKNKVYNDKNIMLSKY